MFRDEGCEQNLALAGTRMLWAYSGKGIANIRAALEKITLPEVQS
jgi:hypothetical protein